MVGYKWSVRGDFAKICRGNLLAYYFKGKKMKKRRWYFNGVLAALFLSMGIGTAEAYQHMNCLAKDKKIAENFPKFSWELMSHGEILNVKNLLKDGRRVSDTKYIVKELSLVKLEGEGLEGTNVIFYNNNWENSQNGTSRPEDEWTLAVIKQDETVHVDYICTTDSKYINDVEEVKPPKAK
jgi:hypothetical protein